MITGVFEGGGIKGLALAGAAAAALDAGHTFERAVGTSAGALVGSLVAAGYRSDELRDAVRTVDWPSLQDAGPIASIPAIGKHLALMLRQGFYRGDEIEAVWSRLLARKSVHTFGDLPQGSLTVVATDLEHGRGIVLPDDLERYGHRPADFAVARAVRMSATVPFLFQPVRLENKITQEQLLVVDGAVTARFPVQLAARGPRVIGFRLSSPPGSHVHIGVRGPVSLARAVMSSGISARESLPVLCGRLQHVVDLPIDRDSLDFQVSPKEAVQLFDEGYRVAESALGAFELR